MRGSLEYVSPVQVSGWVYSAAELVKDSRVLAFSGTKCVGAGRVEIFRRDLSDAGLGDGFLGYSFPISLDDPASVGGVTVRLDGHEAVFLQQESAVTAATVLADLTAAQFALAEAIAWQSQAIQWLFDHGRLEQTEHDFLKAIRQFGAYVRALRISRRPVDREVTRTSPGQAAADALAVLHMREVRITEHRLASVFDLQTLAAAAAAANGVPVVAVWSQQRTRIGVVEGSNADGSGQGALAESPPGVIELVFGPDHLLFLDLRCSFGPRSAAPDDGLLAYTADLMS